MSNAPVNQLTQQPISNDQLQQVTELARKQYRLEQKVLAAEEQLEKDKENLKKYQEQILPEAMQLIGLSSFRLNDGYSITIEPFVSANIPSYTVCAKDPSKLPIRTAAYQWLRDHNFGALIKREITIQFTAGQDKEAEKLKKKLIKLHYEPDDSETVHPGTLKAMVKEQLEAGTNLPHDLLGVHVGNRAKITPVK